MVISDITGESGLRIIEAILAGERNPEQLAALCSSRIKASRQTVAKSLHGEQSAQIIISEVGLDMKWLKKEATSLILQLIASQ
jgi:hypothetical protein